MSTEYGDEIVYGELDPERDSPGTGVAEIVAELEGKDVTEVATMWDCIDDVVREVFRNPPAPEAQVEVTFSYEGYRVTVEQTGRAKFVAIG